LAMRHCRCARIFLTHEAESGTRMNRVELCAPKYGAAYAVHPRPVTGSIGAVAGDVSLSEAARPMACGLACPSPVPCASPRLFMFGGLLSP
jgi:hypothetical protein